MIMRCGKEDETKGWGCVKAMMIIEFVPSLLIMAMVEVKALMILRTIIVNKFINIYLNFLEYIKFPTNSWS